MIRTLTKRSAETWIYFTPDGVKYDLEVFGKRSVLTDEGTGMPEIDYVTQRGPFQDGETLNNFFLRPRTLQFLIRQQACSRTEYYELRAHLLDMLRPNRNRSVQGSLRKVLPNGDERQIDVMIQQGPVFAPRNLTGWEEWTINEVLRFIAFNPVWYDPSSQSTNFSYASGELTFPITFPIEFGGAISVGTVQYRGTWLEYPVIILTGPAEGVVITNLSTGKSITFTYDIQAGEVVTFDLTFGRKTVTRDNGTNLIGYVSADSDLNDFALVPAPEAMNGMNEIEIQATATSVASSINLSWFRRYIGL